MPSKIDPRYINWQKVLNSLLISMASAGGVYILEFAGKVDWGVWTPIVQGAIATAAVLLRRLKIDKPR